MQKIFSLHKFKIRTTLVVPFVLEVIVAVSLVAYISFRNGQQAVEILARQTRLETAARTQRVLDDYFRVPHQVTRSNVYSLRIGETSLEEPTLLERRFFYQLQVFPSLSEIYMGRPDGSIVWVGRQPDGRFFSNTTTFFPQRKLYELDGEGKRTKLLKVTNNFDARKRPWYKVATSSQSQSWTKVYQALTLHTLGISAAEPYYDAEGNLVAVFATDLPLKGISNFLQTLKVSPHGQVFILDRQGEMVATSTGENPFITNKDGKNQRIKAIKSNNNLTKATAKYLQNYPISWAVKTKIQERLFTINQQRHYLLIQSYTDDKGLDLLIAVVVPEADFMEKINQNTRTSIILCIISLVTATIVGIIVTRWITLPILRIAHTSDQVANGDLEHHIAPSLITEVNKLADSFNIMIEQMKNSFNTLERKNEELQISEENYHSIFENALEGIFQSSPEGIFINVNPALAKIYGYASPSEMMASITNIGEQLYVDPEKRTEFSELLAKREAVKNFEYRCYCKDQQIIWVQIDARSVKDKVGNVLYYEGIVQDITDRKRREDDLRKQLEELKIEIDHTKREKEVAMLTESSFFQEVKKEMAEVNLDEFWS